MHTSPDTRHATADDGWPPFRDDIEMDVVPVSILTSRRAPQRSRRRRRAARTAAFVLTFVIVVIGSITYWALNRYVIDHVEVADVAAYEQQVRDDQVVAVVGSTATAPDTATPAAASSAAETSVDATADTTDPVVTESSYTSDSITVSISTVVEGSGTDQITYFVADVVVNDPTQVQAGFANNQFGQNIIADTSDIAAQYDAVLAINGDYYGFRDTGIVIRNGVIYRDDGARDGLVMYADGTMAIYDETTTSADELLAAGAWNTWSFGPALVSDGLIVDGIENVEVDTNIGNHSVQGNQPRTGIGIIDANHYVFVVVDGRSRGYSRGVTMTEFAQIFTDLGATAAYNLDGGGSSTLVFNGDVINNPLGKGNERGTSDIIYVS